MKFLLATDGSEYAKGAARFLRCFKFSPEDEIIVFHAVYWIPFLYDEESYYTTLKEIKEHIAPGIIDSTMEILKPVSARISSVIRDASPEEGIIATAAESGADLIVIGSRGITGMKSFFMGSVARTVVVKSPIPVLVTKLPVWETPEKIRILVAGDGSESSLAAAQFLTAMPFPDTAEIIILQVIRQEYLGIPETFSPAINEQMVDFIEKEHAMRLEVSGRIIAQTTDLLHGRYKNIRSFSIAGDAATEIMKTAGAHHPDLITMGCRGLEGIKGIMGSVSRNILSHARCSVLIGKTCGP